MVRMPRREKVLLASLLIALLLTASGCGDRVERGQATSPAAEEWDRLAFQRSVVIDEQQALHEELLDLTKQTLAMDPFGDEAPTALALLEDKRAGLAEATRNGQTLARLWNAASELPLALEYRTFALQQKEIQELYLRWYANERKWLRIDTTLFERGSELSPTEAEKLIRQKADLSAAADELSSTIDEKERASEQYWSQRVLGK
jgi:hypothetical protein